MKVLPGASRQAEEGALLAPSELLERRADRRVLVVAARCLAALVRRAQWLGQRVVQREPDRVLVQGPECRPGVGNSAIGNGGVVNPVRRSNRTH